MAGHSLGSHIVTGRCELTCMPVELLYHLTPSLAILEWEGIGRPTFPFLRHWPVTLCGSAPPLFFSSAGLGLFHPGLAIPHSTCLHGSGWVNVCPLSHATLFAWCMGTGCGGLLLFMGDWTRLARADLWPLRWLSSCQVQTHVELAFPGYNSMVVATWLDPPCKLTQSLMSDAGEGLEVSSPCKACTGVASLLW